MKAKYHVIYHIGEQRFEFDTVIERGDSPEESQVISALSAKAIEHYESTHGEGSANARHGFFDLSFDFLGST
ncbi:TPA: hypothetical protein VCC33_002155 [Kluyvera cryocrescens]|nr:hypothetical protein [Kluyvera cryocrescens]